MAWIVMRTDLSRDPAVLRIARRVGCQRVETVVGYLHAVWAWFDEQTVDGRSGLTMGELDSALNLHGFCAEMLRENWLKVDNSGKVCVPRWNRWNSQSAKKRLKNSKRQRRLREADLSRSRRDKRATTAQHSTAQPLTGAVASCCWAGWAAADIYKEFSEKEKTAVADLATPAHKRLRLSAASECPVRDAAVLVVHGRLAEGEYWAAVRDAGEAKRDKRKYFAAIVNRMLTERETA